MNGSTCGDQWGRLRVLYVIGQLERGGAERHLAQLVPALREQGIVGEVFAFRGGGPIERVLREARVTVHTGIHGPEVRGNGNWPRLVARAARIGLISARLCGVLRRVRPHVLHYFLPESYLVGAACGLLVASGARQVVSRRSLNRYQAGRPLIGVGERFLHRRMDAVLGNSVAVVRELIDEGAPPERVGLIYNGVEIPVATTAEARSAARARLGLDRVGLVGLTVANLIAYKGHADLLDALARVGENMPPRWRWLMVGRDDGMLGELRARAECLGLTKHIIWAGEQERVEPYYRAADLVVHPSHQEGFSNAVLEAMSYGLPVVATDVGGNPEAVQHGATGFLVSVRRADLVADAIRALIDGDTRRTLGQKARTVVSEQFSEQEALLRYVALYRHIVNSRPGPLPVQWPSVASR